MPGPRLLPFPRGPFSTRPRPRCAREPLCLGCVCADFHTAYTCNSGGQQARAKTGGERYSPNVGEVEFCLHPEFIAGAYKRMVRAGPRSRGPRSPREEPPMREAPKRARHTMVNYEPVGGLEGYEGVAVAVLFITPGV